MQMPGHVLVSCVSLSLSGFHAVRLRQISMNVLLIMETVLNCALTLLEATCVRVLAATHSVPTYGLVMVSGYGNKSTYHSSFNLDINGCATNNGNCLQTCANAIGSYLCSCTIGYVLNADGRTCDGK